jgi:hypothetical protein
MAECPEFLWSYILTYSGGHMSAPRGDRLVARRCDFSDRFLATGAPTRCVCPAEPGNGVRRGDASSLAVYALRRGPVPSSPWCVRVAVAVAVVSTSGARTASGSSRSGTSSSAACRSTRCKEAAGCRWCDGFDGSGPRRWIADRHGMTVGAVCAEAAGVARGRKSAPGDSICTRPRYRLQRSRARPPSPL